MKKMIILLLMTLSSAANIWAQESFIDMFNGKKGITSVYISKSLLGMMDNFKSHGKSFSSIETKIDNIQILTSENRSAANLLKKECKRIISERKFKYLMNVNDNGEQSGIYMKEYANGIKQYILLTTESKETSLIVLTGKMTLNDIKNVMGN